MDSIDRSALTSLTATFQALMPAVTDPQLPHQLALDPLGSGPAGIGGVVGISNEPPGEVIGRRMRALARVRVQTTDAAELDSAVTGVTAAVLAGDRAQQRSQGLLGAELLEIGPETTTTADGDEERFARDVRFKLLFEHLQAPTEAGDVIAEIHATVGEEEVVMGEAPAGDAAPIGALTAVVDPGFTVVDDDRATKAGPSAWSLDPNGRFVQTSGIWGGVRTRSANKPGTYLILDQGPFRDVSFEAQMAAGGTGAIGLVVRWLDQDHFYFLLLQSEPSYRLLGRQREGAFSTLAVRDGAGYLPGVTHTVTVTAQGSQLAASVDGDPPLTAADTTLPGPGHVGLMTHNEPGGFFTVGELKEL